MNEKTNIGLVAFALGMVDCVYMYGNNGQIITEELIQAKARQYPDKYTAKKIKKLRRDIGKRGIDCSTITDLYTGSDRSANGWLLSAAISGDLNYDPAKGPIEKIPEIPGLTVHYDGHMGIYLGNGKVLEARGIDWDVVTTNIEDRGWQHWARVPGVIYIDPVVCPYREPTGIIPHRQNFAGTAARWYQWHLIRAGYTDIVNPNRLDANGTDGFAWTKTWKAIEEVTRKAGLGIGGAGSKTRKAVKKAAGM
jgi:hypothetical protein